MNAFGGNWSEAKIEVLVEYTKAYLKLMNKYAELNNWKLIYFDGFAGSGKIEGDESNSNPIVGAAVRILEIDEPRGFDIYYFVEKDKNFAQQLQKATINTFPNKKIYTVVNDCNTKIESLSKFLTSPKGKSFKVLAFIDPFGMQLKWKSLQTLQKHSVDVWILTPTGIGLNRLLKKNGHISEGWLSSLESFLGMKKDEILPYFYQEKKIFTLFGEETIFDKEQNAIEKSAILYEKRLRTLFKYVSKPYVLKNSLNSIMYHFFMASNNKTAVNIADDITKKYNNGTIKY